MDDKEIKKLLNEYDNIVKKLKETRVIRTGNIVGDCGEYIVSKKLNLILMRNGNKGYDAEDAFGNKYEIKTRKSRPWNKPTVFSVKKEQLSVVDFLIYIEFDNDWNVTKILKIPAKEITTVSNKVYVSKDLIINYSIL